jgi:hypothetical protein
MPPFFFVSKKYESIVVIPYYWPGCFCQQHDQVLRCTWAASRLCHAGRRAIIIGSTSLPKKLEVLMANATWCNHMDQCRPDCINQLCSIFPDLPLLRLCAPGAASRLCNHTVLFLGYMESMLMLLSLPQTQTSSTGPHAAWPISRLLFAPYPGQPSTASLVRPHHPLQGPATPVRQLAVGSVWSAAHAMCCHSLLLLPRESISVHRNCSDLL